MSRDDFRPTRISVSSRVPAAASLPLATRLIIAVGALHCRAIRQYSAIRNRRSRASIPVYPTRSLPTRHISGRVSIFPGEMLRQTLSDTLLRITSDHEQQVKTVSTSLNDSVSQGEAAR